MIKFWVAICFLCLHRSLNAYGLEDDDNEIEHMEQTNLNVDIPELKLDILTAINPKKTDRGEQIVQGDIVVPPGKNAQDIKGIYNPVTFWPNGKISYNFHKTVDDDLKTMIRGAMDEWEKHSCLKFTEKNMDFNYLRFRADKAGCWSLIGRINSPFVAQDVSIGKGCNKTYIIVHEIGHAIGFYHEQSRNDRDDHITVVWKNVQTGKYSQFDKGLENPRGVEYDYTSIMHYGSMAFSAKHFQKNTITSKSPHHQTLIGNGLKISFRDAKLINKMYNCANGCPNKNESMCLNGGFLSPYRGNKEDCFCVCPPGVNGEYCEEKNENYEYYEMPPCGGNITEETVIQTPGYPVRKPPKDSCSWWIQAPEGKRVRVEFLDFDFHPREIHNLTIFHMKCRYERVEIRTKSRYDGDMFCGQDIPPGTVAHSAGQEFIIIIDTNEKAMKGRGLKAKVTFVDPESSGTTEAPDSSSEVTDQRLAKLLPI